MPPTLSVVPSYSPSTYTELRRREDIFLAALRLSGFATISDTTSPQRMALEWIMRDDGLQLNSNSPNFIQRYSISTFYFATTNGAKDSWTECGADASQSSCPNESS
eukprot:283868-Ditylum_brightwellii.AAC.1